MTVDAAAVNEQRERLLRAFRSGQGSTDVLAAEAAEVLRLSWGPSQSLTDIAQDELLGELLQSFSVFPVWLERAMTRRRLALLFAQQREEWATLAANLAIQCQLNEYAWKEDPPETERVETLVANLATLTPHEVMVLACYRPLARLAGADELLARDWDGPVRRVLYEQIVLVREEAAVAAALPSLTSMRHVSSQAVQAQYEANPYPRWRRPGVGPMLTHVQGRALPPQPLVLIAGCGTGRQAILATLQIPGARTLAVDLSRASLAYAVRKTRELGLQDRITYAQADLMELAGEGQFDMVQATGVLHHMADPFEGARRVCRLAKPGGLIALGLYSARARADLEPAKAIARQYTPQTVREFRQAIINLPEDDTARQRVVVSRDFYSTSGCRDLLMHVQEHQLTIPDLRRILDENDLTFLGFLQFEMKVIHDAYTAMFPHDPSGLDLEAWDAFEAAHPLAFGRMYQFWAEKRA
jgi:2-polyprenyl-3-methyl-5-hydroxy-6-metoxy-1,4-benzoquinol methylase